MAVLFFAYDCESLNPPAESLAEAETRAAAQRVARGLPAKNPQVVAMKAAWSKRVFDELQARGALPLRAFRGAA